MTDRRKIETLYQQRFPNFINQKRFINFGNPRQHFTYFEKQRLIFKIWGNFFSIPKKIF